MISRVFTKGFLVILLGCVCMGWGLSPHKASPLITDAIVSGHVVEEVEVFTLEWPGDDWLCDKYEGSEGPLVYRVYRLKSSKKIICINAFGAYCQGDSEFAYEYLFDEKGNAVFSIRLGIYVPNIFSLYQDGKLITEVETRGDGEEEYAPRIKKVISGEVVTSSSFEKQVEEYFLDMKKRMSALNTMVFQPGEESMKAEADSLIILLEAEVQKGITYQPGFVWRKALPGEKALIVATDVRVRSASGSSAGVISKISCYDPVPVIIAVGEEETIAPYGTHAWYQIRYTDRKTGKEVTGWIFGAFIAKEVFPVTH